MICVSVFLPFLPPPESRCWWDNNPQSVSANYPKSVIIIISSLQYQKNVRKTNLKAQKWERELDKLFFKDSLCLDYFDSRWYKKHFAVNRNTATVWLHIQHFIFFIKHICFKYTFKKQLRDSFLVSFNSRLQFKNQTFCRRTLLKLSRVY